MSKEIVEDEFGAFSCFFDEIFRGFREYGDGAYLGEPVSMTEHMLQAAHAAEQDEAGPTLVAAALLHDYGHFGPSDFARLEDYILQSLSHCRAYS